MKLPIILLAILAILVRTIFHIGPNVELVTATLILASSVNRKFAFLVIFAVMAISDTLIGNTNIFLFTWSGFLLPAFFLPKLLKNNSKLIVPTFLGIASNLFFFIWTNFGVWALDSWGMYPKSIAGLVSCYINALPFLKNQLTSTIFFVPIASWLVTHLTNHARKHEHFPTLLDNYTVK